MSIVSRWKQCFVSISHQSYEWHTSKGKVDKCVIDPVPCVLPRQGANLHKNYSGVCACVCVLGVLVCVSYTILIIYKVI